MIIISIFKEWLFHVAKQIMLNNKDRYEVSL